MLGVLLRAVGDKPRAGAQGTLRLSTGARQVVPTALPARWLPSDRAVLGREGAAGCSGSKAMAPNLMRERQTCPVFMNAVSVRTSVRRTWTSNLKILKE